MAKRKKAPPRTVSVDYTTDPETQLIDKEEIEVKFQRIADLESVVNRLLSTKRADDILADFTVDAARYLVMTMYTTGAARDRISAITQILDRGLGKAVERHVSINHDIIHMNDDEMDRNIEGLLHELGFKQGQEGSSSQGFIVGTPETLALEVAELPAPSGGAGDVLQVPSPDPITSRGQPTREDSRGSDGGRAFSSRKTPAQEDEDA